MTDLETRARELCVACGFPKAGPGDESLSPEPDVCWVEHAYAAPTTSTDRFWDMIECRDRALAKLRRELDATVVAFRELTTVANQVYSAALIVDGTSCALQTPRVVGILGPAIREATKAIRLVKPDYATTPLADSAVSTRGRAGTE